MVYIRATKKVLVHLPPPSEDAGDPDGTALGDWYVNRVVVGRKPLLLLVSSKSLLSIVIAARDVRRLPERLADLVAQRLNRLGVAPRLIEAEVSAIAPVHVAATKDRSVLGIVTDFCFLLPVFLDAADPGEAELVEAEQLLGTTPCFAGRRHGFTPDRRTVELLQQRWN